MLRGRQLPPLDALVIFEAAARLGSFSRAGFDLGLTQSAVSRQIGKLEAFLGAKLFTRTSSGVLLTPTGAAYSTETARILNDIVSVTDGVRAWTGPRQITIACSRGIADLWLMPRLRQLEVAIPGLELRLRVTDDIVHLRLDEFDLALFYRRERPSGVAFTILGREEIIPVSRPGAPRFGETENPILLSIEDPLREWLDWSDWTTAAGIDVPVDARLWKLGGYRLAVEAACDGLGITLGWTWLIREHLESGKLVPAHDFTLVSEGRFYLLWPADRHQRRIAREVSDWLVANSGGELT
ncbi:LysR substrate-binding domain-containing protein [Microvirga alba]|uniref:LysR family transcriptional regulator n=1 Tax=Microvirga alba TaxID=2791025 RepID=A0A931BQP9_9HYPH|nr:LysR substrate-binding domain-containing protein [Microvirga alba]MBF9235726.1 LysR family transcriptional regulator [Microvirga alba]